MSSTKKARKRAYIPPSHEVVNRKERTASSSSSARKPAARTNARQAYVPPVPSVKRTAKRLPIYFFLVFGLQFFLLQDANGDKSSATIAMYSAAQAGIVTLVLAPFMHIMDKATYKRYQAKQAKAAGSK